MSKWHKSKINFEQLKWELQNMSSRSKLFQLLKSELEKRGHWKQSARGNPMKGYNARGKHEFDNN